ncbi:MAG: pyruvate, phosphate dikinase, partial [Deltaproteobacteria bacterium]
VYLGEIPTVEPEWSTDLDTILRWADETAQLGVRANADTPEDADRARRYGATGIGLCRTERMFNASDRLPKVIDMIIAENTHDREDALNELLPIQRSDFVGIFRAMSPYPVTIRLLDPPIHEFLPAEDELLTQLRDLKRLRGSVEGVWTMLNAVRLVDPGIHAAYAAGLEQLPLQVDDLDPAAIQDVIKKKQMMLQRARSLREVNPMLGHRGVRLGITYPEIYMMQIRAILEAAAECMKEGVEVHPEIMVPQVATASELAWVKNYVDQLSQDVQAAYSVKLDFHFGTMVEVVRACLTAEELAQVAQFFSFGTNDLTQAVFSFSREDAENKFLPYYHEKGIIVENPFEALDVNGVGRLMKIGVQGGREARPVLKIGICGEHGGHPASIRFCHQLGLDYVSCSGPRVPMARLAAAHAKLTEDEFDNSGGRTWSKSL